MSTTTTTTLFDPARLPAPDDMGLFMHPDVPDCDEDESIVPHIEALGFECSFVGMQGDAWDLCWDGDETAPARWTPTPPQGEGWQIAAKYDTEDGAYALFVRPITGAAA